MNPDTTTKTPPPLLLGAALLFWGWQTGFLPAAAIMALVLESHRLVKARWDFSDDDLTRIWTFCTLLFLASTVYAFTANDGPNNFRGFFQDPNFSTQRQAGNSSARTAAAIVRWLPMVLFLFVAAQVFSPRKAIPLQAISLILRWQARKARKLRQAPDRPRMVNVGYLYFGICLISASVHTSESTAFFWGLCLLLPWALWSYRSPRFGFALWTTTLACAMVLGFFGQGSLGRLRGYLETLNPEWLSSLLQRGADPTQNRTALGQVGRIKQSGTIVIRLEPKTGTAAPHLLREASYRTYKIETWYAGSSKTDFENINHEVTNEHSWVLLPGKATPSTVNIACYLNRGEDLLPLPGGSGRLESLPAYVLKKNGAGAVLAEGPRFVMFDAEYGPGATLDALPANKINSTNTEDLAISAREKLVLTRVIEEQGLRGHNLDETLRRLNRFFEGNFSYSLWQDSPGKGLRETPLARFLFQTRSGHCEYFATATTLLLRELGFPARYAVGYAIHETSGNKYVVRQRDAHAWCLVWNDEKGLWQDFDTTPASWMEEESKHASWFQFLSDAWSRIKFEFSKIRWGETRLRQYILLALGPILLLLLIQILRRTRRRRSPKPSGRSKGFSWQGLDSEFYQLEKKLADKGLAREPSEPLASWLTRAANEPFLREMSLPLQQLLRLHYRYRFDPEGLSPPDRETLRHQAKQCLAQLS